MRGVQKHRGTALQCIANTICIRYLAENTHIGMVPACCRYVLRHAEKEAPKTAIDTVVPHPLATIATSQYCETARKDTASNLSKGMVECVGTLCEIRLKKVFRNIDRWKCL